MAIATGQITIIDYNDALTLSGFISSNLVKTQMYNPDNGSFTPDWTKSPYLIMTPSLYKLGSTQDMITDAAVTEVKWYEYIDGKETRITATTARTLTGTKEHILTVKTNEMSKVTAKDYTCVVVYKDPTTGLTIEHKMSISFGKVVNGSGLIDAIAMCPHGNVFKNNEIVSLTATCELWRGSVVDLTDVTYQWYKQDSSAKTDQEGGIGWVKLDNTTNKYTGVTTRELTVFPSAFENIGVFKCCIKDNDSASTTYNTTFVDTVTFIDNTDPIACTITSSGGDVFKNGQGRSDLTAHLYQAGMEIDEEGVKYKYSWSKFDENGILDETFTKTGKTIAVTEEDIKVKATFNCTIS